MNFDIIEKGQTLDLSVVSKQEATSQFYFGAGWDNPHGPVDLDIVAFLLDSNGKLTNIDNRVYFSNREKPRLSGVFLSEDNTTGDGDGDDESIVIDTSLIPADISSIVIGLAAYSGADLFTAPNAHFRVCDGDQEDSPQIGDVQLSGAVASDTVVAAFTLQRTGDQWALENNAEFHQFGNGESSIKGFSQLYA